MPTQKITELPPAAAPTNDDRLVVVQGTTTPATRRLTRGEFIGPRYRGGINVLSQTAIGLTQTLATAAASWWVLRPANWEGTSLEYRWRLRAAGLTVGDVIEALMYNVTDNAALTALSSGTAETGGQIEVASPWTAFPAVSKHGYVQARNVTAARGSLHGFEIDVRSV